jgi:hypothetical protein
MKNLSSHSRSSAAWSAAPFLHSAPFLHLAEGAEGNEYRLLEGRIEFRPAAGQKWRQLAYSEIQQHMVLETAVAKWVSQLHATAKLAQVLAE